MLVTIDIDLNTRPKNDRPLVSTLLEPQHLHPLLVVLYALLECFCNHMLHCFVGLINTS